MAKTEAANMKATEITCTAILSLLFGIAAPVPCLVGQQTDGQRQHQDEQSKQKSKGPRQQPAEQARRSNPGTNQPQQIRQQQQKSSGDQQRQREMRDQDAQPPPQSQNRPHQDQRQTRQDRDSQRERERDRHNRAEQDRHDQRPLQMPQHFQHGAWQERRARNWQLEHRTWQQRGGYRGHHIPGDRFGQYFGPRHGFRIYGLPFVVVGGYPRFQYGGYWFRLIDPWPEYWPDDWYETDDVYIAYSGDGYYLFNRRYPSVGIAVEILM
jgi:hypothetical protein